MQGTSQPKPPIAQPAEPPNEQSTNPSAGTQCKNKMTQSDKPNEFKLKRSRQRPNKILTIEHTRKTSPVITKQKTAKRLKNQDLLNKKVLKNVTEPYTRNSETNPSNENRNASNSNTFKVPEVTRKRTIRNVEEVSNKTNRSTPINPLINKQGVNFLQQTINRLSRESKEQRENTGDKGAGSDLSQDSSEQKVNLSRGQSCQIADEQNVEFSSDDNLSQDQNARLRNESKEYLLNQLDLLNRQSVESADKEISNKHGEIETDAPYVEFLKKDPTPKFNPSKMKFSDRTLLSKKFRILSGDHRSWSNQAKGEPSNEQVTLTNEVECEPSFETKGTPSESLPSNEKIQISSGQLYKLEDDSKLVLIDGNIGSAMVESSVEYDECIDEHIETIVYDGHIDADIESTAVYDGHINEENIESSVVYDGTSEVDGLYNMKVEILPGAVNENTTQLDEDLILPPSKVSHLLPSFRLFLLFSRK